MKKSCAGFATISFALSFPVFLMACGILVSTVYYMMAHSYLHLDSYYKLRSDLYQGPGGTCTPNEAWAQARFIRVNYWCGNAGSLEAGIKMDIGRDLWIADHYKFELFR